MESKIQGEHGEDEDGGDIFIVAEVVRNLGIRDRDKGAFHRGERRMLDNAKQILASELAMVEKRPLEEVANVIDEILS